MTRHTLFHASDLHLGAAGGADRSHAAEKAWSEFTLAVDDARPDLVLLSGDLVVDDPDDASDQRRAYDLVAALSVPVIVVPGNHDVGDHRVRTGLPADWHGKLVTGSRIDAWERLWGPSFQLTRIGRWHILALNSQLFGSGLEREAEQWRWIEQTALPTIGDDPFVLVTHESLDARPDADDADNWMSIPTSASSRLTDLLRNHDLVAACSGHTPTSGDHARGAS